MTYENSDFARKFRRIKRQYEKCRSSYVIGDQVGVFSQDRDDAEIVEQLFSDFFVQCYHLKDWIKEDKMLPASIGLQVENFINNSRALSLAADITNSEKHLIRKGQPRIGEKVRLHTAANLSGPMGSFSIGGIYNFTILVETEKEHDPIDALVLGSDCISEWQKFIDLHNLNY